LFRLIFIALQNAGVISAAPCISCCSISEQRNRNNTSKACVSKIKFSILGTNQH